MKITEKERKEIIEKLNKLGNLKSEIYELFNNLEIKNDNLDFMEVDELIDESLNSIFFNEHEKLFKEFENNYNERN